MDQAGISRTCSVSQAGGLASSNSGRFTWFHVELGVELGSVAWHCSCVGRREMTRSFASRLSADLMRQAEPVLVVRSETVKQLAG